MPINSQHQQYVDNHEKWELIDSVIDIDGVEQYLIELNPSDTSKENQARNEAYRDRAVFYALTQQTANGFVGTVFAIPPEVEVPSQLDYVKSNVDGSGNSIQQQSQMVLKKVIGKSRDGLLVTFPQVEGQISRADVVSGRYVGNINRIDAGRVVNWATKTEGSRTFLSLVVIKDSDPVSDDGYAVKYEEIYRELFIDEDGIYRERKWRKAGDKWMPDEPITPTDATGSAWTEIPFTFVGAINNDPEVDAPNMYGLARLNISHYRNSADYEDSVWYAGQAQPWMSGVHQEHLDLMKKGSMYVGSRSLLAVPENGEFGFAAAPPNPVVRQAMLDKVDMMIGIGARMITPGGVAKTAEQSANERKSQHSVLSLAAENVSAAYTKCLGWVARYMGADGEVSYELNTDFVDSEATPAELREIIAGFVQGVIPLPYYVQYMKDYGLFDEDKTLEEIAEEMDGSASFAGNPMVLPGDNGNN